MAGGRAGASDALLPGRMHTGASSPAWKGQHRYYRRYYRLRDATDILGWRGDTQTENNNLRH